MNRTTTSGRIVRDPELRYAPSGMAYLMATVATDRRMKKEKAEELKAKGKDTTDFINLKVFGKKAEWVAENVSKGTEIIFTGKLRTDTYEKDGKKSWFTFILVNDIKIVEKYNGNKGKDSNKASTVGSIDDDENVLID